MEKSAGKTGFWAFFKATWRAPLEKDPACRSALEALICYPGLKALALHWWAHALWIRGFGLLARCLSGVARFWTGIEIHPGAKIAPGVFIDHGMGVVIGETAVVEEGVVMFHGSTLGGTGHEKGAKRHPTVRKGALIGAGAKVLGPVEIGEGAKIGAMALVLKNVPAGETAVGVPAKTNAERAREKEKAEKQAQEFERLRAQAR